MLKIPQMLAKDSKEVGFGMTLLFFLRLDFILQYFKMEAIDIFAEICKVYLPSDEGAGKKQLTLTLDRKESVFHENLIAAVCKYSKTEKIKRRTDAKRLQDIQELSKACVKTQNDVLSHSLREYLKDTRKSKFDLLKGLIKMIAMTENVLPDGFDYDHFGDFLDVFFENFTARVDRGVPHYKSFRNLLKQSESQESPKEWLNDQVIKHQKQYNQLGLRPYPVLRTEGKYIMINIINLRHLHNRIFFTGVEATYNSTSSPTECKRLHPKLMKLNNTNGKYIKRTIGGLRDFADVLFSNEQPLRELVALSELVNKVGADVAVDDDVDDDPTEETSDVYSVCLMACSTSEEAFEELFTSVMNVTTKKAAGQKTPRSSTPRSSSSSSPSSNSTRTRSSTLRENDADEDDDDENVDEEGNHGKYCINLT